MCLCLLNDVCLRLCQGGTVCVKHNLKGANEPLGQTEDVFVLKRVVLLSHSLSSAFLQEFLSDREQGQSKLNAVVVSGELVSNVAAKDRVDAVRAKVNTAREDWKNMMSNLHHRETSLQVSTFKVSQSPDLNKKRKCIETCRHSRRVVRFRTSRLR